MLVIESKENGLQEIIGVGATGGIVDVTCIDYMING